MWELAAEARKPCLQAGVSSGLFLPLCSPLCKLQSRERLCDGHPGLLGTTLDGGWAGQLVGLLPPLQEGGVSLPSKLDVFSRRMRFGLVDDDWDPASQGNVSASADSILCASCPAQPSIPSCPPG